MSACHTCGRPDPTVTVVIQPTEYLRDAFVAVLSSDAFLSAVPEPHVECDADLISLLFSPGTKLSAREGWLEFSAPHALVTVQMLVLVNPIRYAQGRVEVRPRPTSDATPCRACDLERFNEFPGALSDVELHALAVAVQAGGEHPDHGRVATLNAELRRRRLL